jgi:hypothetical protein
MVGAGQFVHEVLEPCGCSVLGRSVRSDCSLVEGTRHLDVKARKAFGQPSLHERAGHVRVGELHILEVRLADALSEDVRGFGVGQIA